MMAKQFRDDNTDGYSPGDLFRLNLAWEQIMVRCSIDNDADDIASKSWLDHLAEQLLVAYDAGTRGDDLVAWAC